MLDISGNTGCDAMALSKEPVSKIVADVILSSNPSNGYFNIRLRDFRPISINVKVLYLNSSKVYFISKANNNSTTNISMHAPFDNYVVELSASP